MPRESTTKARRWHRRIFSLLLCAVSGSLLLAGCDKPSTKDTSAPRISKTQPETAAEDVLPPQSEPPLTDPDQKETVTTNEPTPPASDDKQPDDKTRVLFAGKNLDDWEASNFGGEGPLELKDDAVIFQRGADLTGMNWKGKPLPKINYEVTLEAQRIEGSDFFCGIVFPVNDATCSFVAGGWGGSTIGLSSVDDIYAAENETGTYASFEEKTWYKFKLRVSASAITAWIDGKQYVYLKTKGRKLSLHPAMEPAKPFGIAAFATVAVIRDVKLHELTEEEIAAEAKEAEE